LLCQSHKHGPVILIALGCIVILNAAFLVSIICAQESAPSLTFQAFTGLADIYKRGGEAPDLVAKLNTAIDLIQQAQMKRNGGDDTQAAALDIEARTQITEVIGNIPAAEQTADRAAHSSTLAVILLIPVSVVVSTFIFYVALRTWRAYGRLKLYEMTIIEKKKAQD